MSDFEPGIYPGISAEAYDAIDAARHTFLSQFDRTAAHAQEYLRHPPAPTEAMELGQATHAAVLEPDLFEKEWVCGLTTDSGAHLPRTSNANKARWAEFEAKHHGKGILKLADWEMCLSLRDAVRKHPAARELLYGAKGVNELSGVYDDPDTGIRCKFRLDRYTTWDRYGTIIDFKTARNASRRTFGRDASNLGYYSQAWQYLHGLEVLAPAPRRFIFIVAEKEPPFAVAVYEVGQDALQAGKEEYDRQLAMYAEALQTGRWPGYGDEVQGLWVPPWRLQQEDR